MIHNYSVGSFNENVYIIENEKMPVIIIDPGFEWNQIVLQTIVSSKKTSQNEVYIILTHGHIDHTACLESVSSELKRLNYSVTIFAPLEDKNYFGEGSDKTHLKVFNQRELTTLFGDSWKTIPQADVFYEDAFVFPKTNIKAIHTPGHTQGSSCLYFPLCSTLFSGDTLFRNGIGRTDFFDGDEFQIYKSIQEKLFTLPPDTIVLPGHGSKTNISSEMHNN